MFRAILMGLWLAFAAPVEAAELRAAPAAIELAPAPPVPEGMVTVPGLHADVHGHPEMEPLLLDLSRHVSEALPGLAETLGVPIGSRIQIYVAASDAEFHAIQDGRPPEWADATAWPESGAIFLRANRARGPEARPLNQVLDHELTHVLLGRAFVPYEPPRWLHEGLARVMAREHDPETTAVLAKGMLGGGLYSLEELQLAFPHSAQGAQIAYAQSSDFVAWLRAEYGDDALRTTIRGLAAGKTMDAALYASTGETLADLDDAWRSRFSQGGAPLWFAGAGDLVWWGTGLLAAAALLAHRVRFRRRMQRYAERERERDAQLFAEWFPHPVPPPSH